MIEYAGMRYAWHEGAFLTRAEAEYAVRRLWALAAGSAAWEGPPAIEIPAVGRTAVLAMHQLPPGKLPWVPLEELLPRGQQLGLDSDRLPALCQPDAVHSLSFDGHGRFPLDLVTAAFLLLTRWEEAEMPFQPDEWGNYQARDSLAHRQGFLDRPVLDEWSLVLRSWLRRIRPQWTPAPSPARMAMTHDVDGVHKFRSWYRVVRSTIGSAVRTRRAGPILRTARSGFTGRLDAARDPYFQGIRSLLEFDEMLGQRGTFFFMAAKPGRYDDGYDPTAPLAQRAIQEVLRRGHEVGWHPSYRSADEEASFLCEKRRIDDALPQAVHGARCHYLRWRPLTTWPRLAQAGIRYDSTLGFNETIGFRCGTAHPFPVWDRRAGRQLPLEERPLIVQDGALLHFMGLSPTEAIPRVASLHQRAARVGGLFTVLLHNGQSLGMESILPAFHKALETDTSTEQAPCNHRSERPCAAFLDS